LNANTLAAIASAIAAFLSAAATGSALYFSNQQVEAAYLGNLYNNQVTTIIALEKSVVDLKNLVREDGLSDEKKEPPSDMTGIQHKMADRQELYAKAHSDIFNALEGAELLLPKESQGAMASAIGYSAEMKDAVAAFVTAQPTPEAWLEFSAKIDDAQKQLGHWNELTACLSKSLMVGKPLQGGWTKACDLPG
jgi:hypothetical protein